jgi:hypothetical protein
MSNNVDWSGWILEKNAAHAQEELKKGDWCKKEEQIEKKEEHKKDMCPKCKKEPCKCLKKAKDMSGDEIDNDMMMSELESLVHHVEEIREHMGKGLAPDWVKAKISRAASIMSDIAHYIQGLKERK